MRRIVPFSAITLAHIGLFYALQSGLPRQPGQPNAAQPKEIFANLITADKSPAPVPQKQRPVPQVPQQRIVPPTPVRPIPQQTAPAEHAITTPPVVPQPVAQPQPAAAPSTSPASAAPSAPAPIKTLTSGVQYAQAPEPEYPSISKRMGEEGRVVLRVLVNDKGRTESVEVQTTSGSTRLDEAAKQALKRALFKPHTEDGKAAAVYAIVPITFKLNK